jgi:hypothetical protein
VVIGLGTDSLVNKVIGEPTGVLILELVLHVTELRVEVGRGEVVDDKQDLVRDFFGGFSISPSSLSTWMAVKTGGCLDSQTCRRDPSPSQEAVWSPVVTARWMRVTSSG